MMESQRKEPEFVLRGWVAVAVSLAAAIGLLISLYLLVSGGAGGIEVLGTSNFDTINVENGSASAPSIGFTNDSDVGIYRSAANQLGLTVGGAEVMSVTSSGLNLEGVAFNGPVVMFGGTVSNGVGLAHGLGTTPTFALCGLNGAGAISQTVYITSASSNATSVTLKIMAGSAGVSTDDVTAQCIATR